MPTSLWPWFLLALAIVAEVAATVALRASLVFTKPGPSAAAITGYAIAFYCLAHVQKTLPASTVYAIWAATGTAFMAAFGMVFFGEAVTLLRIGSVIAIIGGVIGLGLAGGTGTH